MTRQDYLTEYLSAWKRCMDKARHNEHKALVLFSKCATVNETVGYYLEKHPYDYLEYWEGVLEHADERTVEDGEVSMILRAFHNQDKGYIQILPISVFYPDWDSMEQGVKDRIKEKYDKLLMDKLGMGITWSSKGVPRQI